MHRKWYIFNKHVFLLYCGNKLTQRTVCALTVIKKQYIKRDAYFYK